MFESIHVMVCIRDYFLLISQIKLIKLFQVVLILVSFIMYAYKNTQMYMSLSVCMYVCVHKL